MFNLAHPGKTAGTVQPVDGGRGAVGVGGFGAVALRLGSFFLGFLLMRFDRCPVVISEISPCLPSLSSHPRLPGAHFRPATKLRMLPLPVSTSCGLTKMS